MLTSLYQVLVIVLPAFLIIFLGFALQRLTRGDIGSISRLAMNIFVPAFAFRHIYEMQFQGQVMLSIIVSSIVIMLIPGGLAWFYFRRHPQKGIYLPIMFMNSVNLPFPIFLAAFGPESIPLALVFYLVAFLGIFTLGLYIATGGGKASQQIFREPVIYVIFAAGLLNFGNITLPEILIRPIQTMEGATIPLVLIVLGMQLARVEVTDLRSALIAVGFRFGGGLLAGLLCVLIFSLEGLPRKVVLMESVMPSAVINLLVAEKYRIHPKVVASTIFLSTLFSVIILPLALVILR
jgi:predicted permease